MDTRQRPLQQEPALWGAVGNTPLFPVKLGRARGLYLKAEWLNPGGSVKDRTARGILRDALCRGELPGRRLLDASSGNTGIAYAMLGAAAGIDVTICLPGNASPERRALLEIYGAEVVVTDRLEGTEGASRRAIELAANHAGRYYFADQYSNPANIRAHRETTGPEIWAQTKGKITHFVAAMGTTGTMMGTGGFLKEMNPHIRLVGVQPDSPFHGLEGLKHLATTTHPPAIYDPRVPDRVAEVATERADRTARQLAKEAGYLVGWSAGAAVAAALDILEQEPDACVVAVGCDSGVRYLSEPHRWRQP
ncbi:MAG TPA: PLP-dependent cysteine synthase family protein [Gemmatimonadales bacterium]|nr:PLP-dependent cysteine synthase family protein [Gemmatimonadales bacterium]